MMMVMMTMMVVMMRVMTVMMMVMTTTTTTTTKMNEMVLDFRLKGVERKLAYRNIHAHNNQEGTARSQFKPKAQAA